MTRKSKIARLPRPIRDELNRRLDNGQPGIRLVEWLNNLPEVNEILAREFQGRRITPQNISEWKRGGYHDWLAQQEHAASLQDFLADAKELGDAASPEKLTEAIFNFGLVHYAAAMQRCAYRPEHRDNLNRCSQMLNDVIRLRNCDLAQQRFDLDTQKLAFNAEKLELQTELARQRLELDRARLELVRQRVELESHHFDVAHQESRAAVNPEGVLALSPGLRRDAGRYPGESSQKNLPNPERVVPRTDQALNANRPQSPSAAIRNPEITSAKTPLEINPLQPNPTKSNDPFFIFPQTITVGQATCPSPSFFPHLTVKNHPQAQNLPQTLNIGITQHATRNTQHATRNTQHATRTLNLEL